MIREAFSALVYEPLYNGLVFLVGVAPGGDVGVALIALTLIVRAALFPVTYRASVVQEKMRLIEPEIAALRARYANDREQLARRTMALYRERRVNPFVGVLALFVQVPFILGLYFVFLKGGLPSVDPALLYPFVAVPGAVSMSFLGILDISAKSIMLAAVAGGTQFIHARYASPASSATGGERGSFASDFAKSMQFQMRFILPVFIGFIAYTLPAAIGLHWAASNAFSIAQDAFIRRRIRAANVGSGGLEGRPVRSDHHGT